MISQGVIDIWMLAALSHLLSGGGISEARFAFSVAPSENYNLNCLAETIKRGLFNGGALAKCCHRCLSLGSTCAAISYSALNRSCNLLSAVNQTSVAQSASSQCTLVKSEVSIMPSIAQSTIRSPTTMQSTMVAAAATDDSSLSSSEYFFSNQANGSSISTTTSLFNSAFGGSLSSKMTTATVPMATTEVQTMPAQEEPQTTAPNAINVNETSFSSIPGISSETTEKMSLVPASGTAFEPLLSTKLWTTVAERSPATNDSSNSATMAVDEALVRKAVGDTVTTDINMVTAANVTSAVPGYTTTDVKSNSSSVSDNASFSLNDKGSTKASVLNTTTDVAYNISETTPKSTAYSTALTVASVEAIYSTTSNTSHVQVQLSTSKALAVATNATLMPTLGAATTASPTTKSATSTGWASRTITVAATSATSTTPRSGNGDNNSQG